jgi:hypothetical protein
MNAIWSCTFREWEIGIGDPGWGGWLIVVLYALTGLVACVVASRAVFPEPSRRRERAFWYLLAASMLLLALNKQLDLQTLLTDAGRCLSQIQGWYETRRIVQAGFILGVLVGMLFLLAVIWRALRGTLARNGLAVVGLVFVLGFVIMRAAGFHHMDGLINMQIKAIRLNWVLEMIGPLFILAGGFWALRARPDEIRDDTASSKF